MKHTVLFYHHTYEMHTCIHSITRIKHTVQKLTDKAR